MVEFAHREALLMGTDAPRSSRRIRERSLLAGFAYQDDAPVAGEALVVSRHMRGRNLLRAAKLLGAAIAAIALAGLVVAFLSHGIDFSFLVPDGLSEFASHANVLAQSPLQPNLADFGSVQQEPWWTVPASVRDLWRTAMMLPPQAKGGIAFSLFAGYAIWAKMIGLSNSKKPPHDTGEDDHEI